MSQRRNNLNRSIASIVLLKPVVIDREEADGGAEERALRAIKARRAQFLLIIGPVGLPEQAVIPRLMPTILMLSEFESRAQSDWRYKNALETVLFKGNPASHAAQGPALPAHPNRPKHALLQIPAQDRRGRGDRKLVAGARRDLRHQHQHQVHDEGAVALHHQLLDAGGGG